MCDCPASIRSDDLDTPEGQVAALAPFLHRAAMDVAFGIEGAIPSRLIGKAIVLIADNYEEHGRNLFDMLDDDLQYELERELEDATVYRAEQLRRAELKGSEQ